MKKRPAIIVDFDGTLCDAKSRRHYLEGKDPNYDKFYEAAAFCQPHEWCKRIIENFISDHEIILVTGQPEEFHKGIEDWMEKHDIAVDRIYGRKSKDFRPDTVIKKEIYDEHIADFYNVLFCLDDRKKVVDMWRAEGLTVLHCDDGEF